MTPIFCCGFECGLLSTAHWDQSQGTITPTFETTSPLSGLRSLRCNTSAQSAFTRTGVAYGAGIWVWRFRVNFSVLPNVDCNLSYVGADGVFFKASDSKIYAGIAGGYSGATGVSVTTGVTYYIDVRVDSTADPYLTDVSVNGTPCGQGSSAATVSTTAKKIQIGLTTTCTATALFDDFVLSATSGDYPIGNGYVDPFIPTADGTHNVAGANDFERSGTGTDITNATTTAFQLIDDVPLKSGVVAEYINLIAPPNATDYVEVVFGPAPGISTPTVAPRAVEAIAAYASASAGTNNLRLALNDNGTLDDVFNANGAVGTTAAYARKHYADPPSAATVWTLSGNGNFNNVRMRCFTSDAAPDPWWASAMIEAEFPAAAASLVLPSLRHAAVKEKRRYVP